MEHPVIENMVATGYPTNRISVTTPCANKECDDVLYVGDGYVLDGERFCSTSCMVDYLFEQGLAEEARA